MISQTNRLYNRVIDSLDLRVNSSLPPSGSFQLKLPSWQKFIQASQSEPHSVDPYREFIPDVGPFTLLAYGKKPYKYILSNPSICDIRIWNPSKWCGANRGKTGQLYINFRSQYLQYQGLDGVRRVVSAISEFFYGLEFSTSEDPSSFIRVSRIDLACDVGSHGFKWADLDTFVSRARYRDTIASHSAAAQLIAAINAKKPFQVPSTLSDNKGGATDNSDKNYIFTQYEVDRIKQALMAIENPSASLSRCIHDRAPQTLYFGKFGGALYARIYNKSASLDKQQKGYMRDIWAANGWDGSIDVWRTEFSMSGDFLKTAGDALMSRADMETGEVLPDLRDFELVASCLDSLWTYATRDWLKQIDIKKSDSNDWRGIPTAFWESVSSAFSEVSTLFRAKPPRNPKDEQLQAQLKGVALSLLAIQMQHDKDESPQYAFLETVASWLEDYTLMEELCDRRVQLGIDDYTGDTLYSAQVRQHAMSKGFGS